MLSRSVRGNAPNNVVRCAEVSLAAAFSILRPNDTATRCRLR